MLTAEQTTTSNRHIESLQHLFENSPRPVNWLVIAHDDPRMIDSLSSALSGESAAILRIPQDACDFTGSELSEAIEWALQQGELENIVLVGHSHAASTSTTASLVSPATHGGRDAAEDQSTNRLLAGVRRSTARTQQARNMFTDRMQQLSEIPVVQNRWANAELAVYGLFYQADSGVFLAYDVQEGSFRPLLG